MAQSRPKTTTDPLKAIAGTITDLRRRVRDLELRPDPASSGGASVIPAISAQVWDGYGRPGSADVGTSGYRFKMQDFTDEGGFISLQARSPILGIDNADTFYLAETAFDDGYGVGILGTDPGYFVAPTDGRYLFEYKFVSLIFAVGVFVEMYMQAAGRSVCREAFTMTTEVDAVQGGSVFITASDVFELSAGDHVTPFLDFTLDLGSAPYSPTDTLVAINRGAYNDRPASNGCRATIVRLDSVA